ncbi:hypothetical protein EMO92_08990 [Bifidobacterium reuteri]|uniref:TrbL/VirB6 plasmid conjugal transfer protein n=5 Tax=Bifidobacterium TaxID=1678 RepID=A0A087CTQ2_9BIFI|nr:MULTISPECIES: hypothetical protein [Bifidobacterium]KAA8820136.1 hypothetical protein EMO90_06765 [Bifidobacterium vespertilionis]KAA8823937.1 hypothetical protein EM848_03885 [Bifidobacterium vespertilionis]KAA8824011.1 hypothetical protein EMO92_08990 [Bifidobacterium reuteri]KAA8828932.1 hypothetical protein EMO91_02650 [Bifidobacterium myosotis]KAA8832658.1 hypothetical protein EM849_03940 [Bifidobacterium tissieri]
MEDFIVAMLNMIGGGGAGSITAGLLSQAPETWNPALYQLAVNVHGVAVKPLTSVVLAVMFTLELARNSTRIEADRDLGVKIVAGTMFKIALVFIAVQNAGLFIRMFNQATQFLMQGVSSQMSYEATGDGGQLGDLMRDQIRDAGVMGQAALFFLLVIPWLLSQLASVVFTVVLYVRFIELYALTAFQSLPFAFLVHEDTKAIGVGFFKSYARTSVNAVCVFICLVFYQRIVVDAVKIPNSADKGMVAWVTGNFGNLMMAGILLFFVIAVSQRVSRAIAGGE